MSWGSGPKSLSVSYIVSIRVYISDFDFSCWNIWWSLPYLEWPPISTNTTVHYHVNYGTQLPPFQDDYYGYSQRCSKGRPTTDDVIIHERVYCTFSCMYQLVLSSANVFILILYIDLTILSKIIPHTSLAPSHR